MGRVPIHSSKRLADASIANRTGNTLPPQILRSSAKIDSFTVSLTKHIQVHIFQTLAGRVFFNQLRHGRGIHNFARTQQDDLGSDRFHIRNDMCCHKDDSILSHICQQFTQADALLGVKTRRRFVQINSLGSPSRRMPTADAASCRRNRQKGACPIRRSSLRRLPRGLPRRQRSCAGFLSARPYRPESAARYSCHTVPAAAAYSQEYGERQYPLRACRTTELHRSQERASL